MSASTLHLYSVWRIQERQPSYCPYKPARDAVRIPYGALYGRTDTD
jgi:hypothetical protein